ncbi:M20/M25/M40 family metallo-hydrolase [Jiella pelagia]|uniref:M20/M25/M40 family metallo-hydrolase n=1 Tax=Jiella pelagia TaxID=2986949 RepID=A0ABY7C197_9HYPH|nr:M20/M25/M40 family metallo-hydrolase [Jiella pelagia]WAP69854.1 M20/M25/M40 family metallo-hydrolase [Jiella pelagia]
MTRELVKIDSQTPPSDTRAAAAFAADYLSTVPGIEVSLHSPRTPIQNLVARLGGSRPGPRLIVSGHLDTYPIGARSQWTRDPLGGEVVGNRLYGRGAADMKGGVAASLVVMRLLAEATADFPGELVLALAGDEESMGEAGTQFLIDTVPACRADAVIVPDVGSPQILRCGEKGMIWLSLEASGRAAHGAHVHRGDNAIASLIGALDALRQLERMQMPETTEAAFWMKEAKALSEPLGGAGELGVMSRVTVNVGTIAGGTSPNLVPDTARAELDIRLPIGVTVAAVEAEIARLLADHPMVECSVTRRYEATWTSPSEPIASGTLAACREILPVPAAPNMRVGASDARLWRRAGMPTVVCGLTPTNLGGPDESLEVEELPVLAAILSLSVFDFLHGG